MSDPKRSKTSQTSEQRFETSERSIQWILDHTFDRYFDQRVKRLEFKAKYNVRHNFTNVQSFETFENDIDDGFDRAVRPFLIDCHPNDYVSFHISSEGLSKKVFIRSTPIEKFDKKSFRNTISIVAQSNKEFLLTKELNVQINIWHSLKGRGRSKRKIETQEEFSLRKQSVITIKGDQKDCGYRAIAVGIKFHEWNVRQNANQERWKNLIRRSSAQHSATRDMFNRYGLDFSMLKTELTDKELRIINEKVFDFQVIVISQESGEQMFVGTERPNVIYIEDCGDHYNFIKSMPGYRRNDNYCKYCNRGYQNVYGHVCVDGCRKCHAPQRCISDERSLVCEKCNVHFDSQSCFDRHLENVCRIRTQCPKCEITFISRKGHTCGVYHCNVCRSDYTVQPHHCYIKSLDIKKLQSEDNVNNVLIAYDIEAKLVQQDNGDFLHVPFLLVMTMCCDLCTSERCPICVEKWNVFKGEDCVDTFVENVRQISERAQRHKSVVSIFAHNNSRYDGHFLFRSMIKQKIRGIDLTMRGLGLMKVEVGNVRFIDSLLLLQAPLSKLPKMFGLNAGDKGFFPYYYEERSGSVNYGDIEKSEFGYGTMTEDRAKEFDKWYENVRNVPFDYDREAEKYCRQDVRILMEAIKAFRKLFKTKTSVDPINRTFTIAGVSFEYFRTSHIIDEKLYICPTKGFYNMEQSASGNAFLDAFERYLLKDYNRPVIREYKIGPYTVDGFIDLSGLPFNHKGIVIEYKGCHWHFHDPNVCPLNLHFNPEKNERDQRREALFERLHYKVIAYYECQWKTFLERESDLKRYYDERRTFHIKMRKSKLYIDPRETYKGGLVDVFQFHHVAGPGETIEYIDWNSLYPLMMTRFPIPVGAPTVINEGFDKWLNVLDDLFGLISCKVLPPNDEYFPVLHKTIHGKNVYPLCYTCALEERSERCVHNERQRSIRGKWTTPEIQAAVRQGYRITKVYQIVHWEQRDHEMLPNYVKSLYVEKQEASGWPANCDTEQKKCEFMRTFKEIMNVPLDRSKIANNPGLRTIAKLGLNSGYGKLGQKSNLPQTLVTNKRSECWDLMLDENVEILSEERIEDYYVFTYRYIDDVLAHPGNTSVVVAAFITAYARLTLMREMSDLHNTGNDVLYCDTDSIVYIKRNDEHKSNIGPFLGQLSDEIEGEFGPGSKIIEFYTTGPKSYTFKVQLPDGTLKTKIKSKGLSLNVDALQTLNFDSIKDKALNKANERPNEPTLVRQHQFRLDRQHHVHSKDIQKKFNVTANKRFSVGNVTYPFGFNFDSILS